MLGIVPRFATSVKQNRVAESEIYTRKSMERAAHILDLIDAKWRVVKKLVLAAALSQKSLLCAR